MTAPVLVDTSAWISYFRGDDLPCVRVIDWLIDEERDLATCDPVLMEMIQGCRADRDVKRIHEYFSALIYVPTTEECYRKSAIDQRQLKTPSDDN